MARMAIGPDKDLPAGETLLIYRRSTILPEAKGTQLKNPRQDLFAEQI